MSKYYNYFFLFIFVLFVNLYLRLNVLFFEGMFLDDWVLFPKSLSGTLASRGFYFGVHSLINIVFHDIVSVRLFYLILFSLLSLLCYHLLVYIKIRRTLSLLITMILFVSPQTIIFFTFINGSYVILFLCVYVASLVIYLKILNKEDFFNSRIWFAGISSIFVLIYMGFEFSTGTILLPLSIILISWWKSRLYYSDKTRFLIFYSLLVMLSITFFIVRYTSIKASHGYGAIEGRVSYDLVDMVKNYLIYWIRDVYFYLENNGTVPYNIELNNLSYQLAAVLLCVIAFLVYAFYVSFKKDRNRFWLMSFLVFCLITASLPYASLTLHHTWYFFVPHAFLIILVFLSLDIFSKHLATIAACFLMLVSLANLAGLQKLFDLSVQKQKFLIKCIKRETDKWEPKSSVYFVLDEKPYMMGVGGPRDKHFFRTITNRRDITKFRIRTNLAELKYDSNNNYYIYRINFGTKDFSRYKSMFLKKGGEYIIQGLEDMKTYTFTTISEAFQYLMGNNLDDVLFFKTKQEDKVSGYESNNILDFNGESMMQKKWELLSKDFHISFYIKSMERNFSEGVVNSQYPPMPMISNYFYIYQRSKNMYHILIDRKKSGGGVVPIDIELDRWLKIDLLFIKNYCFTFSNGNFCAKRLINEEAKENFLTMSLGKGAGQRYWKGKISNLVVNELQEGQPNGKH